MSHQILAGKSKFEALTAHPHASAEARLREVPYNIKAIATIISLSYGEDPEADAELSRMCTADNKPVQCWEVYEEQAKALFVWFNAVLDSLSAHPHASDCDKTTYDVLGDQRTCVGVPASGIAKMMDAVENPKQPNEALKKLMRGHASDCDKQGDR